MIKHLIDSVPAGPEPPAESSARILLVEDNAGDARLTQESLATQKVDKFTMVHVASLATACLRLRGEHFDAVLLDLSLPDSHGPATLSSLRQQAPSIPIVVLTGLSDEATAIEAVTQGAQDYLVKGETDGNTLARRLRFAIQRHLSSSTHAVPAEQPKLCKTLGLLGSKGGVGTSTVACYLATALYDLTKEPVLLADFDFDCGVLGFLMEVETKYSLMDALQNADHLEAGIWSTLVSKKAGGLDVIAAPRVPASLLFPARHIPLDHRRSGARPQPAYLGFAGQQRCDVPGHYHRVSGPAPVPAADSETEAGEGSD
jgi:CheY-like chemotaxis protein